MGTSFLYEDSKKTYLSCTEIICRNQDGSYTPSYITIIGDISENR